MLKLEPTIDLITGEPEPALSENALRVLEKRYLKKDESGKVIETPRELFWRGAWDLAPAGPVDGGTGGEGGGPGPAVYPLLPAPPFLPDSPTPVNSGVGCEPS